jgi:hypothetical protein
VIREKEKSRILFLRLAAKNPEAVSITTIATTKPMIIHISLVMPPSGSPELELQ